MKFTPKTKEELTSLLADGMYDFSVISAEETTSRAGNDMIALKLEVYDDANDRKKVVFDWLVNSEKSLRKILAFCETTGLLDTYNAGELTADKCFGKSGRVKIEQQDAQDGYPEKNVVGYYVTGSKLPLNPVRQEPAKKRTPATKPEYPDVNAQTKTVPDDDVPF
jgi:hypothetical protein